MSNKHGLPCFKGCGASCCSFFIEKSPHLHCFKCGAQKWDLTEEDILEYVLNANTANSPEKPLSPIQRGVINPLSDRGISKIVADKYRIETLFDDKNTPYARTFNHIIDDVIVAQKIKYLAGGMQWTGAREMVSLYGKHLVPSGGKYLTITEGEEDAAAAYQMMKDVNPNFEPNVVSIPDGAGSAEKVCKKDWEYINSFENIILCFDGDETGKKAAEQIARLFNFRPKIVSFPDAKKDKDGNWNLKDANDYLKSGKTKEFTHLWWRAEKVTPKGVSSFKSLWDSMTLKDNDLVVPLPWPGLEKMMHGIRTGRLYIFKAKPKIGKCFGKDTPVRMFDGSVKMIQDIQIGDLLMGDDGTSRTVLDTVTGSEKLFAVHQTKRDSYVVNESHILCVKHTSTKEKIDISLLEYLKLPNAIRWNGYSAAIHREVPIDIGCLTPYILGVWLGDGHKDSPTLTNTDSEIIKEWFSFGEKLNLNVHQETDKISYRITRINGTVQENPITASLRQINVLNNKHIPSCFLTAPKSERLQLLAGLLDTDGYYDGATYVITQARYDLAKGIQDLARSLGFRASLIETKKFCMHKEEKREGLYYNVTINGSLHEIPCRVKHKQALPDKETSRDPTVCGLSIEELGVGDYYGFTLDGNRRFLLEDCTVVHNTQVFKEIAYHIATTTPHNSALILLEETKKNIGLSMCALHMSKPVHHPNFEIDMDELATAHADLSGDDRITLFDPEDSRTVENIMAKIMYFVKAHNAKFVFLDHISMLAYQSESGDERRFLDKLIADLKELTTSLDICIMAITHVNDDGQTRGSRAFAQLCDFLVSLERDKLNSDPIIANTTEVIVEENRITGESGTACKLYYCKNTGRMTELDTELDTINKAEFDT